MNRKFLPALATLLALAWNCPAQIFPAMPPLPKNPMACGIASRAMDGSPALGQRPAGSHGFGGVNQEHLQLNEDTLWSGGPYDADNPKARAALPQARKLIFDGKYDEAFTFISSNLMANPVREMPYETVGDLFLDFPTNATVSDYRRDLNLDTAIAGVSYTADHINFKREIFSSPADQVIVVSLTADKSGQISFSAGMTTPQNATVTLDHGDTLVMSGVNGDDYGIKGALKFQARIKIIPTGGSLSTTNGKVSVVHADSVMLLIAIATSYKNYHDVSGNPEDITQNQIEDASQQSLNELRAAQIAAHRRLFRRVTLDLGGTEAMKLPTDERIQNFATDNDPQFAALYFQFDRNLLDLQFASGSQPANLQGIWNNTNNPPWGSKYTININTEMNYWPAESCNLGECVEPLTAMVLDLTKTGSQNGKSPIRSPWLGGASQHRFMAGDGPGGRPRLRHVADGRSLALPGHLGTLPVRRR